MNYNDPSGHRPCTWNGYGCSEDFENEGGHLPDPPPPESAEGDLGGDPNKGGGGESPDPYKINLFLQNNSQLCMHDEDSFSCLIEETYYLYIEQGIDLYDLLAHPPPRNPLNIESGNYDLYHIMMENMSTFNGKFLIELGMDDKWAQNYEPNFMHALKERFSYVADGIGEIELSSLEEKLEDLFETIISSGGE